MSTFEVKVVPVILENHPTADLLSIVRVDGYTVCVRTEDWKDKNIGCFIPPDSIVPSTPMFDFLGNNKLIKAKKLRGIGSFGLLVPAPEGAKLGDDVAEILGITHYNPPEPSEEVTVPGKPRQKNFAEDDSAPSGYIPVYDLENARKHNTVFQPGELVNCLEKIHGENIRIKYDADTNQMKVGSHYRWKKADLKNGFWQSLWNTPGIENFCIANPDCTIYGESAGKVKGYKYGMTDGKAKVFVFDILKDGRWMDYKEAKELTAPFGIPWCPAVAEEIPYDFDKVCELAEGNSLVPGANHQKEGIVVASAKERWDDKIGRVKLKFVSLSYLSGK